VAYIHEYQFPGGPHVRHDPLAWAEAPVAVSGRPRKALPAPLKGRRATPAHTPAVRVAAGQLLKREDQPPTSTLYVFLPLGGEAPARPMTGIFIPQNFRIEPQIDIILYLHGHHRGGAWPTTLTIDQYWDRTRHPYFDFREGLNATRKNAILVAPTLGPRSESGKLIQRGGFDSYMDGVLTALSQFGPYRVNSQRPTVRSVILACHSGGGWPMRRLATSPSRYEAIIKECWGFDCLYNSGDEDAWASWAKAHPSSRLYIHYGSGGTAGKSEALRSKGVPNASVEGSVKLAHNLVPKTHWQKRLRASFLSDA
jgi:hypothetical protein